MMDIHNEQDFELIYKKYYSMLYHIVLKMTEDKVVAEDIIHDVFIKIWNKRNDLVIHGSVKSYLIKSCINSTINFLNQLHNKNEITLEEHAVSNENNNDTYQHSLDKQYIKKRMRKEINQLPTMCKTVFILNRFEKMSYKDIASYLDISVKTVDNHLWKAVTHLRKKLNALKEGNI